MTVLEYFAAENPGITVVSLLPGIIETKMFQKSKLPRDKIPFDTGRAVVPPQNDIK